MQWHKHFVLLLTNFLHCPNAGKKKRIPFQTTLEKTNQNPDGFQKHKLIFLKQLHNISQMCTELMKGSTPTCTLLLPR